jgi:sec-independent protein translocase protein TatA
LSVELSHGSSAYITKFVISSPKKYFMGNLGFQEILLIAVVVLVLFGGRKIPEFMRGLGKGIREFNDAKSNVKKELEEGMKEKDKEAVTTTTTNNI